MSESPDFTLAAYRELLGAALGSGYRFLRFAEMRGEVPAPTCLLRHDIDSEIFGCGPMLDVEAGLGVKATYFLMIRSTAYNLLSLDARAVVERVLRDGHEIGLHFMGEAQRAEAGESLADAVQREAQWIGHEFGIRISAVSFHQPSAEVLRGAFVIGDLVNTYNAQQMGPYFYVSDTNMNWRHEHPREIFARCLYPRLQLLIHPIWWTREPVGVEDKWGLALRGQAEAVVRHWQARERTLAGMALADRLFRRGKE